MSILKCISPKCGKEYSISNLENEFNLLTGDLDYSNAADGHYPYKAAALVALTEGNPSFLGWRNPENPPAP